MFDLNIQKFDVWEGRDIYMLREDLLPVACGGNKVRIACKLIEDAIQKGSTAIVGYEVQNYIFQPRIEGDILTVDFVAANIKCYLENSVDKLASLNENHVYVKRFCDF